MAARVYYADEAVTLYHGDCRDVLPELGPVDHVITDPPYETEAHTQGRRAVSKRSSAKYPRGVAEPRPLDFAPITAEDRRIVGGLIATAARGWVLVFCQVEGAMLWRDALAPARYMRTQIWRKPDGAPQFQGDRPGMGYESIVTCWAGAGRPWWNGGGRHGVYEHLTVKAASHQTQKPERLMADLVALFSRPGELILDPFAGSGTTGVAAKRLGRRCILIELDAAHCATAAGRLAQAALALAPAPEPTQQGLLS